MATEELPADLDKLKITHTHRIVKSVRRNPFYDADNGFDVCSMLLKAIGCFCKKVEFNFVASLALDSTIYLVS